MINSDLTNSSRNMVLKTTGSGTSISITLSNRDAVKRKCDKFPLFLFGNDNGYARCSVFLINIQQTNAAVDGVTNLVSSDISYSTSGNTINIKGLRQYGYYTVIAPPGVYIDNGGITI